MKKFTKEQLLQFHAIEKKSLEITELKEAARELKKILTKEFKGVKFSVKTRNTWYTSEINVNYDAEALSDEKNNLVRSIVALFCVNDRHALINSSFCTYLSSEYIKFKEDVKRKADYIAYCKEQAKKQEQRIAEYNAHVSVEKISNDYEVLEVSNKEIFVNALQPSLNKNDWKTDNDKEVEESSIMRKYKITRIVKLSNEDYNYFSYNLLTDYEFLDGTGGSYLDEKNNEYIGLAVLVVSENCEPLVIDAQGYAYARYTNKFVEVVADDENIIETATATEKNNNQAEEQPENEEFLGADTIKELDLDINVIEKISKTLDWTIDEVLECDDFHIEGSVLDMLSWVYDGEIPTDALEKMTVHDPNVSLLENLLLNHENIFNTGTDYLFIYH